MAGNLLLRWPKLSNTHLETFNFDRQTTEKFKPLLRKVSETKQGGEALNGSLQMVVMLCAFNGLLLSQSVYTSYFYITL